MSVTGNLPGMDTINPLEITVFLMAACIVAAEELLERPDGSIAQARAWSDARQALAEHRGAW